MSISLAVNHDEHSALSLETDLTRLAHDMQHLRDTVHLPHVDVDRFAQLERSVSSRLDVLAHNAAAQDSVARRSAS